MSSPSGPVASPTFGAKSVHTPGAIGAIPARPTARQLAKASPNAPKAAPKPTASKAKPPAARKAAPAKAPARRGKR